MGVAACDPDGLVATPVETLCPYRARRRPAHRRPGRRTARRRRGRRRAAPAACPDMSGAAAVRASATSPASAWPSAIALVGARPEVDERPDHGLAGRPR
ncbi:hypothetical protein ACU686_00010 [Yinghuangia aomiensis]